MGEKGWAQLKYSSRAGEGSVDEKLPRGDHRGKREFLLKVDLGISHHLGGGGR